MSYFKRLAITAVFCIVAVSIIAMSVSAYAYDNDYYFDIHTKGNQHWAHSSDHYYRGATTTATPWKVNFSASSEGVGTIMQFFLYEHSWPSYPKHSDYKNVVQGSGNKYFHAYDSGCQQEVWLGVRNNNYTSHEYDISGYWDEETAKHAFND